MNLPEDFSPPPPSVFAGHAFHPVMALPEEYDVYDFTQSYDPNRERRDYGIGRYNEHRPSMYQHGLFTEDQRTVHMGIDIGAPQETEVRAFYPGIIIEQKVHAAKGDYGPTLITAHQLGKEHTLYALWGHLSQRSLTLRKPGDKFEAGQVLGWIGSSEENGGWNPHLHFQLSWLKPEGADLPGVVSLKSREAALKVFPDPRLVLGPLY